MIVSLNIAGRKAKANLHQGIDISIPIKEGPEQVNCFYAPLYENFPVRAGDFVGSTTEGGLVNFKNVRINPHGNGTHTECVGHIAIEPYSLNQQLRQFHFSAKLITIIPRKQENGDRIVLRKDLEEVVGLEEVEAIIIRTEPNHTDKMSRNYSGTNPPYVEESALTYLADMQIKHLLIDLPSVDREEDEGKLLGHRAWWKYPGSKEAGRDECTITELIFVPTEIKDGYFLLNIQIASFEIDVSPSKPVIYPIAWE